MKRGGRLKRGKGLKAKGARASREADALEAGRRAALERAGWRCERCGEGMVPLHVHHVVSRARGAGWEGLHKPDNLRVLCGRCHDAVHSDPAGNPEWIKSRPEGV